MQIVLVAVGKLREAYAASACSEFAKRVGSYYPLRIVEVKASQGSHPEAAMREEAARILSCLSDGDRVWLLERTGTELSSEGLALELSAVSHAGARRLAVIVGGTFGVDETVRKRADFAWSLSRLTFLHEWARMIVLEQIYRAAKISRNEPYHH